jgi:hypothetical protein
MKPKHLILFGNYFFFATFFTTFFAAGAFFFDGPLMASFAEMSRF